jgi:hypothetical protein
MSFKKIKMFGKKRGDGYEHTILLYDEGEAQAAEMMEAEKRTLTELVNVSIEQRYKTLKYKNRKGGGEK